MKWMIVALLSLAAVSARAQELEPHEHGVGGIPDWYDATCCDRQDCRPVPDADVDFGRDENGQPVAIYKPLNLRFPAERWRASQDERYHPCFRGNAEAGYSLYCFYIPTRV